MSSGGFGSTGGGKLSPEQRKIQLDAFWETIKKYREKEWAEFGEQPPVKVSVALRKQFEAALTPEQIAAYRNMAFRNGVFSALSEDFCTF